MKLNFFKKFFLVNTMVFLCSITIIVILLSIFIGNYITEDKKETLKENCNTIATLSSQKSELDLYNDESIALFRSIFDVTEAELFIADANGKVTICSCEDWSLDGECEHNQKKISKK